MRQASVILIFCLSISSLLGQVLFPRTANSEFEKSLNNDLEWLPIVLRSRETVSVTRPPTAAELEDLQAPKKAVREMEKAEKEVKKDRLEPAIEHLKKAVELHPTYSKAYVNLAILYLRLNRTGEAENSFRKAVEANEKNLVAKQSFGYFCLAVNRPDEAVPTMRSALALEPDNARSAYYLGEALFRLGKKEEAEQHLRKAIENDGRLYLAAYRLATLCAGRGLFQEALVLVNGIKKMQHPGITDQNLQQLSAALQTELQKR